jgi:environmental stress-induced protein Ves
MKLIRASEYRVMPWKNGGGTTTEVAISPEDAGLSGKPFDWRVSIADIAADGPFSKFRGYDRHIMAIGGKGVVLDTDEAGRLDLTRKLTPVSFAGEWSVNGRLKNGPVRDFNLMLRRDVCFGGLTVRRLTGRETLSAHAGTLLCHMLEGEASAAGHIIAETDSLLIANEDVTLMPLAPVVLAVCEIRYHGQALRM